MLTSATKDVSQFHKSFSFSIFIELPLFISFIPIIKNKGIFIIILFAFVL